MTRTPTPAQRRFLIAVKYRDWVTASFVRESTRVACRHAGWVTDSTIRPSVTAMGLDALRQVKA